PGFVQTHRCSCSHPANNGLTYSCHCISSGSHHRSCTCSSSNKKAEHGFDCEYQECTFPF
ncbi:hypothetical protein HGM15179_020720, partial [Zosterops borbonicus]